MDPITISNQAIETAMRQAFPDAPNPLPIVALSSDIYGKQFQWVQIGSSQMAIPHIAPPALRADMREIRQGNRWFHPLSRPVSPYYAYEGSRVTPGVDPQLFVLRESHVHPLYYACYRLLVELYRLIPLHENDGIRNWNIWVTGDDLLMTVAPSPSKRATSVIPAALRQELIVVGTDAGLWLGRAWNWNMNHPRTVQDLLNTVIEVINSFEIDQPPPPEAVPGMILGGRQAVIM
ncbi:MAG: hypothetical protein M1294_10310 [Firmicutes bacterium]|jgi:hypothetical protein|uniref:Uncharacterized protein n=1 Tax=Sulfobacillus benefaciens TaxID=453960 RepID=A0A2T2X741_9FIRM|nr:hypothetical protein [Bacillota bacterium]PSR30324.1 MAG: hypothetical protein C7B43_06305 [Sulfobacillus benefaciens]HBQ94377.1 hypothetical protein [Sulfobacillus sp.]